MAITDAYATAQEYREVGGAVSAGTDAVIDRDLIAVSRWLEHKLGRFFNVDASDVARIYVTSGAEKLWIDDLSAAPTTIKIDEDADGDFSDETALASTDYELRPLNAVLGPEPGPYTHIVLTSWGTKGRWGRNQRVEITGKWGWASVPESVKSATIEFTRLWRMESPRATTRISEIEGTIAMSGPARSMLDNLMSKYKVIHIG